MITREPRGYVKRTVRKYLKRYLEGVTAAYLAHVSGRTLDEVKACLMSFEHDEAMKIGEVWFHTNEWRRSHAT